MPLAQLSKSFLAIHQFTAFGLRKAVLNFGGNIGPIISQPLFLLMEQPDGLGDEFIGGLVGTALHVGLDQRFQLGLEMNRHSFRLPDSTCIQGP
jgi:hypothetical protein